MARRRTASSELLRRGAANIDERLANQSELRIDLLHIIGKTQLERGLIDDAVDSLDRAIVSLDDNYAHPVLPALLATRGIAAYEQLEPALQAEALRVHGAALEMSDRLGEAERVLSEAWTLQRQLDADHVTLAKIENDLGIVYWRQADLEQAA